jgi:hypothetical protein
MHMRQTNLPTSVLAKPQRWLPDMDLNHDKQIQSLLCYRYTIGQNGLGKFKRFRRPVKSWVHHSLTRTMSDEEIVATDVRRLLICFLGSSGLGDQQPPYVGCYDSSIDPCRRSVNGH